MLGNLLWILRIGAHIISRTQGIQLLLPYSALPESHICVSNESWVPVLLIPPTTVEPFSRVQAMTLDKPCWDGVLLQAGWTYLGKLNIPKFLQIETGLINILPLLKRGKQLQRLYNASTIFHLILLITYRIRYHHSYRTDIDRFFSFLFSL